MVKIYNAADVMEADRIVCLLKRGVPMEITKRIRFIAKAVDLLTAGIAIGMKVFLSIPEPVEFSPEWLNTITGDEFIALMEKGIIKTCK